MLYPPPIPLDSLHVNPPRHPELRDLLGLVYQPHVQEKLSGTPDSALEGAEDPRVRVARVFADCRERGKLVVDVHAQAESNGTYRKRCASRCGSKPGGTFAAARR